jgi:hypothetical protein
MKTNQEFQEQSTNFFPGAERYLTRGETGVNPEGNGKRLRHQELEAAAAASLVRWRRPCVMMPDPHHTVLLYAAEADWPVWLGYHDGDCWRAVNGTQLEGVELWGEIPYPAGAQETTDQKGEAVETRFDASGVHASGPASEKQRLCAWQAC